MVGSQILSCGSIGSIRQKGIIRMPLLPMLKNQRTRTEISRIEINKIRESRLLHNKHQGPLKSERKKPSGKLGWISYSIEWEKSIIDNKNRDRRNTFTSR